MWCNDSFIVMMAVGLVGAVKSDLKPKRVGFPAAQTSPYSDPDSAILFRVMREHIGSDGVSGRAPSLSRDLTLGNDMSTSFLNIENVAHATAGAKDPATFLPDKAVHGLVHLLEEYPSTILPDKAVHGLVHFYKRAEDDSAAIVVRASERSSDITALYRVPDTAAKL